MAGTLCEYVVVVNETVDWNSRASACHSLFFLPEQPVGESAWVLVLGTGRYETTFEDKYLLRKHVKPQGHDCQIRADADKTLAFHLPQRNQATPLASASLVKNVESLSFVV